MTSDETRPGRRSGGRAARVSARAADAIQVNPCPPGQLGGAYKPLSQSDIEAIYGTAVRLLAELGIGDVPAGFTGLAVSKGAIMSSKGRLL